MSNLTSLIHLPYNLSGPIPQGNQLLTLDDPLNYAGNPYVCGAPLPNKCFPAKEDPYVKEDYEKKVLFYLVIALGFATRFWGVIKVLLFKKSSRHTYFQFVEKVMDRMFVAVAIKVAKLLRRMQRNHADE